MSVLTKTVFRNVDPEDMAFVCETPKEELQAFEQYLKVFHKGEKIMTEGSSENSLCLIRKGIVGVYREVDGKEELVSVVPATNFVGEMELFLSGNRLATIRSLSPQTLVYEFQVNDLSAILSNPRWSEILISRLCVDLKMFVGKALKLESDNIRLLREREVEKVEIQKKLQYLISQNALLFSAITELYQKLADNIIMKSKDWVYLSGINEMIANFIKERLPDVAQIIAQQDPAESSITNLQNNGLLPEKVVNTLSEIQKK